MNRLIQLALVLVFSQAAFSSEFETLRAKFLANAASVKAKYPNALVQATPVQVSSNEQLPIDSIYIPAREDSKNLIILTSGIHGVEAHAGSEQENLIMSELGSTDGIDLSKTSVFIIHSMNPYGTKYGRRFNEHNVDLNRNCFDIHTHPFPGLAIHNADYATFRSLLENQTTLFGLLWNGLLHIDALFRAVSGQYEFPQGIYYGGQSVEAECAVVEQLIRPHLEQATNIAHIDFHTGLGKGGINQIMLNTEPSEPEALKAYQKEASFLKQTMFPKNECDGICKVQEFTDHGFATNGDITQWLNQILPDKRKNGIVLSVTSEIGTDSPVFVLPAIINENYCYWHRQECGENLTQLRTDTLYKEFNPSQAWWWTQVAKSGAQINRALARFSKL